MSPAFLAGFAAGAVVIFLAVVLVDWLHDHRLPRGPG
jgi:hypothetical protein